MRIQHPDDHYCAAILKYLKCKSVEMKDDVMLFFCDDKAKVPVGNPGSPESTGVRGRQSIVPVTTERVALRRYLVFFLSILMVCATNVTHWNL